MRIGAFVAANGGFAGHLHTLTFDIELTLVPTEAAASDNAPDFRIMAQTPYSTREIGVGWKHIGERAGDYVAVQIDDPMFAQPLRANLFQEDADGHVMVWSRAAKREAGN